METLAKITPNAYSHSRLDNYAKCPLSFKLTYIDKIPTEDSDALEIGAAAHEFFEKFVRVRNALHPDIVFKEHKIDEEDFKNMAAGCFQREARNQSNFKDYLEICRTFAKMYKPDPTYPVVTAEKQIAFDPNWKLRDWFAKDVRFRAKIDLIEEPTEKPIKKIRITDWKTGYAGSMDTYQLDIYSMAAAALYPDLEQVQVAFYYVKSGFSQVKLLEVKDIDITRVQIDALAERIDSDTKWKPKPGVRCLNCSVAAHCTAKPSDLKAISGPDDAVTLGTEIAALEAQAKAKKKALNVYCQGHGAVEAGGLTWNHYPAESLNVPIPALLTACVEHSVDPSTLLNTDSKALKKAFKQNPPFGAAIEPHISVDVSTRFYAKRSESDE